MHLIISLWLCNRWNDYFQNDLSPFRLGRRRSTEHTSDISDISNLASMFDHNADLNPLGSHLLMQPLAPWSVCYQNLKIRYYCDRVCWLKVSPNKKSQLYPYPIWIEFCDSRRSSTHNSNHIPILSQYNFFPITIQQKSQFIPIPHIVDPNTLSDRISRNVIVNLINWLFELSTKQLKYCISAKSEPQWTPYS